MKYKLGIIIFAIIEILIGSITIIAVIFNLLQGKSTKSFEVLIFVLITAATSTGLGIGLLRHSLGSYHLLLLFSFIIIFSKILIFANIISLNGALETTVPSFLKNIISVIYHGGIIFYFTRKRIKEYFGERRGILFSLKLPFDK